MRPQALPGWGGKRHAEAMVEGAAAVENALTEWWTEPPMSAEEIPPSGRRRSPLAEPPLGRRHVLSGRASKAAEGAGKEEAPVRLAGIGARSRLDTNDRNDMGGGAG